MRAPCDSRRWTMPGIRAIRCRAKGRLSRTCRATNDRARRARNSGNLLAPYGNGRRALDHRPFVLVDVHQRVADGRAALPGGAEPILRELPGSLALGAGPVLRFAGDLAVGREC